MASRGRGGRGRGGRGKGRGRGRGGGWRQQPYPPPPLIRPIFDWSEVADSFPQAAPLLDSSLLTQFLSRRVQDITPSSDEQPRSQTLILSARREPGDIGEVKPWTFAARILLEPIRLQNETHEHALVQGFCTKVATVVENMILTGEGEELMLDEVRAVGSQKKGTSLAGCTTADLVVLLRELPSASLASKLATKVMDVLNSAQEEGKEEQQEGTIVLKNVSNNLFELESPKKVVTRVYVTTTADKVYGMPPRDVVDTKPYEEALRMIRHIRWWDDHTSHLKSVRSLVRILKDMQRHVPGLKHLNPWYIELLSNCAVIPLIGDEPLTLVDGFRRVWQLLAAGLFLPGSIGIPDPCEESDCGVHENLSLQDCDELTRNAQMILQMLHFGAYREVLAVDGATPVKFTEPYSFGSVTLNAPVPACDKLSLSSQEQELPQEVQQQA